jgi:hypothetical protein
MKFKAILFLVAFSMLAGCAVQEEPVSVREPRKLITKDDYEDLQIKPRKEESVEVDYKKEGTTRQNFDPLKK